MDPIQLGDAAVKKSCQIYTFRIVVKLAAIYGQPRRLRKRFREPVSAKQIRRVIFDSPLDGDPTIAVSGKFFNLCQSFEDEAGMEVVHKVSLVIYRVKPRAVRILRLED